MSRDELRRLATEAQAAGNTRSGYSDQWHDYYAAIDDPAMILGLLNDIDRLEAAIRGLLETDYTFQVSGHDVDCNLVQTTGLPCSCGRNDAVREAVALLPRTEGSPE